MRGSQAAGGSRPGRLSERRRRPCVVTPALRRHCAPATSPPSSVSSSDEHLGVGEPELLDGVARAGGGARAAAGAERLAHPGHAARLVPRDRLVRADRRGRSRQPVHSASSTRATNGSISTWRLGDAGPRPSRRRPTPRRSLGDVHRPLAAAGEEDAGHRQLDRPQLRVDLEQEAVVADRAAVHRRPAR